MRSPNRVTGLVFRDNRILLIHRIRNGNEFWVFPGGAINGNEDPDTAINRVMLEQTGLWLVSNVHLFDEYDEHAFTWYNFFCELSPGDPHYIELDAMAQTPDNRARLEWVDLEQIPNLNVFPNPERLIDFVCARV
ncbi:MAG: NUDIX domain-containing protein [Anaerolineaceae bacterium]|nr:NUDIX domain-containing protein [Anaerolineaceae bacterium]MBN2677035.1 NUDIX domain-containing protein [Anaerolineaceae bacterium]